MTLILGRVSAIDDGGGHADMIQDLNDLAVLGRENADPLTAINYDMAKLENAATLADEMAEVLAIANGDKMKIYSHVNILNVVLHAEKPHYQKDLTSIMSIFVLK